MDTTAPVLQIFNPNYRIHVTTDASKWRNWGRPRALEFPDGRRPVTFTFRILNYAESTYLAREVGLLSIVDTLRLWRWYLLGKGFTVYTDHYPLKYLETQQRLSPKEVRWIQKLSGLDFTIKHIKGRCRKFADALSRTSLPGKKETTNTPKIYHAKYWIDHSRLVQ